MAQPGALLILLLKSITIQYVHLSLDKQTAWQAGRRHDKQSILLEIYAYDAYKSGIQFYLGNDYVWLSEAISPQFIDIKNG